MTGLVKKTLLACFACALIAALGINATCAFAVTQDQVDSSLQHIMLAYYRTGANTQFNNSKLETYSPAEATSQDTHYLVCSRFIYNVYQEAFDIELPKSPLKLADFAQEAADDSATTLFYSDANDSSKVMTASQYDDFIASLRPGDVLVYSNPNHGHTLIVYDVFERSDGTHDAMLFNANGAPYANTKLVGTARISLSNAASGVDLSKVELPTIREGGIKVVDLRSHERLQFTDTDFNENYRVCVLRFTHVDDSGSLVASYNDGFNTTTIGYDSSRARLYNVLPDLSIEKTVDACDNTTVDPGTTLTYTLALTNNGSSTLKNLHVNEELSGEGTLSASDALSCTQTSARFSVASIAPGETAKITFQVVVGTTTGSAVTVTGKLSDSDDFTQAISTGSVSNTIGASLSGEAKAELKAAFATLSKTTSGVELINDAYKEAGFDLGLTSNSLDELVTVYNDKTYERAVVLQDTKLATMVLDNYWGGLKFNDDQAILPSWGSSTRARTINEQSFQDGDILLYTNSNDTNVEGETNTYEDGLYAFIYFDGAFVGVNYPGTVSERNTFNAAYYTEHNLQLYTLEPASADLLETANLQTLFGKDKYVILRPSLYNENAVDQSAAAVDSHEFNIGIGTIVIVAFLVIVAIVVIVGILSKRTKRARHARAIRKHRAKINR